MTSGSLERPGPAAALIRIALQIGATSVAHVDVEAMLSGVCVALPPAAGAHGAILMLNDPADPRGPDARRVFSSDTAADRLALVQQRAATGPVPAAIRGDRTLATPDLTRGGPPVLAAAAADCGLVRSLVVPVPIAGRTAGVLQLLGRSDAVLDEQLAALLRPVVTMLAARLADVRELGRLEALATARAEVPPAEEPATEETPAEGPGADAASAGDPERTMRLVARSPRPACAVPQQNRSRTESDDAGPDEDPRTTAFPQVPAQRRDGPLPSPEPRPNGQEPGRRPRHRRHDDG